MTVRQLLIERAVEIGRGESLSNKEAAMAITWTFKGVAYAKPERLELLRYWQGLTSKQRDRITVAVAKQLRVGGRVTE